ncbi:hypothetical protein [Pseudomonas sp. NBRC 100443]|uniref:hypothetical protein n=1 Tax=Pseudomonas sp. NBRC 100443 TaxID=1113665 RepID=UPI0024A43C90|nr:hypothetical protein [Pseudomonas sp. NBRC 100443]GLU37152.1 hypothetical protein Pssp01_12450 [Pseudomonas sp. NBRC 100443]
MSQKPEIQRIAEEAAFKVSCAMDCIDMLRSTLLVLRESLDREPSMFHFAGLCGMAIYNADDWHNQFDCDREQFEIRLKAIEEASK